MRIERIVNRSLDVNTYLVIKNGKCLVIDPSFDDDQIMKAINREHVEVEAVLLTHAHFDHFVSANVVNIMHRVPLFVHRKDVELLYDPEKNISTQFMNGKSIVLDNRVSVQTIAEDTRKIGSFDLQLFHVPGHSPGSVAVYFKDENILFSGDILFQMSVGRTDLYAGNERQLITNIKNKLFRLPSETIVYPGHGEATSIGFEKTNNPYFKFK